LDLTGDDVFVPHESLRSSEIGHIRGQQTTEMFAFNVRRSFSTIRLSGQVQLTNPKPESGFLISRFEDVPTTKANPFLLPFCVLTPESRARQKAGYNPYSY
jgi:hypothetical protein